MQTTEFIFGLARVDHDGDHVEVLVLGSVQRAYAICHELNKDRRPGTLLEPVKIPVHV